jgi:hypothetical protein
VLFLSEMTMQLTRRCAFACLLVLTGIPALAEDARAKAKAESEKQESGAVELFDGKTLDNWKVADFAGGGDVRAENGQLMIGMGQPMSGLAWSGKPLPKINYEVEFEAQRVDGNDFFVGLTFPIREQPCTLIVGGWGGGLTGFSSIDGLDASENETTGYMQVENGRWYKGRLRVSEARVDAYIDGRRIAGFDHRERKVGVRIEVEQTRPFGFSTYRTTSALRNLKLRELTEEERRAAVAEADKAKHEDE